MSFVQNSCRIPCLLTDPERWYDLERLLTLSTFSLSWYLMPSFQSVGQPLIGLGKAYESPGQSANAAIKIQTVKRIVITVSLISRA